MYIGPQKTIRKQCFPLYSLLLALGNPTVDYLSLDVEGTELGILRTIPWDKVTYYSNVLQVQIGKVLFFKAVFTDSQFKAMLLDQKYKAYCQT